MDIQGYAIIRHGAQGTSAMGLEAFYGRPVRVMEFAQDGAVRAAKPALACQTWICSENA